VDSLLAKAGILKEEDAGKRRMMDFKYVEPYEDSCSLFSRKEEQERQITIKSTGISLHYVQDSKEYIINLVDRYLHPFVRQFLICILVLVTLTSVLKLRQLYASPMGL
jgi:hypothetical protein